MANIINVELEKPWKAILQSHPTKSLLTLRSLWDVLYDKEGRLIKDSTNDIIGGFKLDHDIICYSTQEYSSTNSIYSDNGLVTYNNNQYSAETLYQLLCIDASIAKYDPRAKCKTIENNFVYTPQPAASSKLSFLLKNTANKETSIFRNNKFSIHDKDSVLLPSGQIDFVNHGVFTSNDVVTPDSSYISTLSYRPPYTSKFDPNNTSASNHPIYLVKEDNGFKGTLSASITMSAYNRIVFNPYHMWTAALVAKALWENLMFDPLDHTGIFNDIITWNSTDQASIYGGLSPDGFYDFIFRELPYIIDNGGTVSDTVGYTVNPNGDWATLLKNTYIWIKAPFFGDYIKPNVFNQDLNEGADVIHKNLILSNSSDFSKYDKTTDGTDAETNNLATPPYVPSVSPTLDLLTSKYLNTADDSLNVNKDTIERLIEDGDETNKINSNIGSIAIAPQFRKRKDTSEEPGPIRLPNYFDPELKAEYTDYIRSNNDSSYHVPTIVPQTGNLYIDGRIISPTTDEIWTYLKQLTEGRMSDDDALEEASNKDTALPIGTNETEKRRNLNDTRLTSVPNSEFQFQSGEDNTEVYGDVLKAEAKVDTSEGNILVSVTKHINNNDGIKYVLFDALKRISKSVTTFDTDESEDGIKSRDVVNFTAWAKKEDSDGSDDKVNNGDIVVDAHTIWTPRSIPLSLRELEAAILGNKYNLNSFARFVKENYTVAGKLGYVDRIESDKGDGSKWVSAAGSLYQFHRDYNFKVEDPNTFFRLDGNGAALSEDGNPDMHAGMDATFNDLLAKGIEPEDNLLLYDSDVKKTSKRPLLVANYGKSEYLPETEGAYYGSDVYLAADGTWRYKQEHVRLPILRSEY